MSDDDVDVEKLKEETEVGNRVVEDTKTTDLDEFSDDLLEFLVEVESGDRQKTVSVWDGDFAALLLALEENEDVLNRAGENLRDELGRESDDEVDRAEVVRLVLRAGLRQADPDLFEALLDARAELARRP